MGSEPDDRVARALRGAGHNDLLACGEELRLPLRRVGSGRRLTFAQQEAQLSEWMAANARVVWMITERPWLMEPELIATMILPLKLDQNNRCSRRSGGRHGSRRTRSLWCLRTVRMYPLWQHVGMMPYSVLVFDRDALRCKSVAANLISLHFAVQRYADEAEAVAAFRENTRACDLVVTTEMSFARWSEQLNRH